MLLPTPLEPTNATIRPGLIVTEIPRSTGSSFGVFVGEADVAQLQRPGLARQANGVGSVGDVRVLVQHLEHPPRPRRPAREAAAAAGDPVERAVELRRRRR